MRLTVAKLEIAGHLFDISAFGPIRCIKPNCQIEGGALYTDVLGMQKSNVGKSGPVSLCHYGATSDAEYLSVLNELERISASFKS